MGAYMEVLCMGVCMGMHECVCVGMHECACVCKCLWLTCHGVTLRLGHKWLNMPSIIISEYTWVPKVPTVADEAYKAWRTDGTSQCMYAQLSLISCILPVIAGAPVPLKRWKGETGIVKWRERESARVRERKIKWEKGKERGVDSERERERDRESSEPYRGWLVMRINQKENIKT